MKVFISYSRRDEALAHFLAYALKTNGVACLIDRQLRAGVAFDVKLQEMIKVSDVVLVLLTSTSVKSAWVNQEVGYALAHEKPIWPLALENDVAPVGMLAGLQAHSLFDWSKPFDAIDGLVSALRGNAFVPKLFSDVSFDQVITGRIERTKFIVNLTENLLAEGFPTLNIFLQAAFSPFAVSSHPLYRVAKYHSDEYVALLMEEKRLLSQIAESPRVQLKLLLWPVRAYSSKHLAVRYESLLAWMRATAEQENVDYLIGRYLGPNRYIVSDRVVVEGYKLHHTPGYEMTLVKYNHDKIQNAIREFEMMYRSAEEVGMTKATAIGEIERLYIENSRVGEQPD